MDKPLIKKAAIQSVCLMLSVIMISYIINHYEKVTLAASDIDYVQESTKDSTSDQVDILQENDEVNQDSEDQLSTNTKVTNVEELKNRISKDIWDKLGDNFIAIAKPKGDAVTMELKDLYINKSIQLNFTGLFDQDFVSSSIYRIRENELFIDEPIYTEIKTTEMDEEDGEAKEVITKDFGNDFCHGIEITLKEDAAQQNNAQVLLELDTVYAYLVYEDKNYFYIDLREPSEVYDKILVIDPGHGGKDGGALSKGEEYFEKNINLEIVLELKKLLDQENIKVYYTRLSDTTVFLRPRANLANAVNCDYFVSIHCNANEVTSPNGTEILYYDKVAKGIDTDDLATLFADEIAKVTSLEKRGLVKKYPEEIFIMDQSAVPTILIEVGYLTNNKDMNYLSKAEHRMAVAQGIYNSIMRAYQELPTAE